MNLNNLGGGKKLINHIIAQGKGKNRVSSQTVTEKNPYNTKNKPK